MCKFCDLEDGNELIYDFKDTSTGDWIEVYIVNKQLLITVSQAWEHIEINIDIKNCPMCGKELTEQSS